MGIIFSNDNRKISFDNNSENSSIDVFFIDKNIAQDKNKYQEEEDKSSISENSERKILNDIMQKEYEETMKRNALLFSSHTSDSEQQNKTNSMLKCQSMMMKCYEENQKQSLKCSSIVKQFSEMVLMYQSQA